MQNDHLATTPHPVAPEDPQTADTSAVQRASTTRRSNDQGAATGHTAYYGYKNISYVCARFITHLFDCPEQHRPAGSRAKPSLPHFIAYTLHRTKRHPSVIAASLVILRRLKGRFPSAKGLSGHRLFISAFMVATKVFDDHSYSNKSWVVVGQRMFPLREINQMEREMCKCLDWEFTFNGTMLASFEKRVVTDFSQDHPSYPEYPLSFVSERASGVSIAATAPPYPTASTSQRSGPSPFNHPLSTLAANTPSAPCSGTKKHPASAASASMPDGFEHSREEAAYSHAAEGPGLTRAVKAALPASKHPLQSQMFAFAIPSKF